MASLRRKPNSRYWIACFTHANGERAQRSTKTTDRKLAQKLADEYEAVASFRKTEAQVRRVLSDLHRLNSGSSIDSVSIQDFLAGWLRSKTGSISESTRVAYDAAVRDFCEFLGERAVLELLYLSKADIAAFRDSVAASRSPSTANHRLKILRVAFQHAWRDGTLEDNPAAKVSFLKARSDDAQRRPFTLSELQRLVGAAENEWKGMILFGLYTGQRLGDLVRLRWSNIDLGEGTISFTTQKTRRRQILPIAKPLREWLEAHGSTDHRPADPIFLDLFSKVEGSAKVGALSNQFYNLMASIGLVPARSHAKQVAGSGRDGRRIGGGLSFHSLRHTATSLMKNAGISPAIVQEFVGHDSKAMSEHYTHIELASLRTAAEAIPHLT